MNIIFIYFEHVCVNRASTCRQRKARFTETSTSMLEYKWFEPAVTNLT